MPGHKKGITNRTIYIDAKDRIRGGSGSDFLVVIRENQEPIVGTMVVKEISIPFTFYQINASNNQISVREATGGAFVVVLPPGNYSGADLETELKAILDVGSLVPQTYTVVFSGITGRLTITASAEDFGFEWETGAGAENSAHVILGYGKVDTALLNPQVSTAYVNTCPEHYILIRSAAIQGMQLSSTDDVLASNLVDATSDIIAKVPIAFNGGKFPGDIIHFAENQTGSRRFMVDTSKLRNVDIRLTFPRQESTIDLNGNDGVSLTILIEQEKKRQHERLEPKRITGDPF